MTIETKVFLYAPRLNQTTGRWQLVRGREGGGMEIINQDFGTEGAAIVLAETINAELKAGHVAAVDATLRRFR